MAYLYVRKNGRAEIREARSTARGPRSRTLASFTGPLTGALLDRAESAASGPIDREALRAKARERGIGIEEPDANREARALLAKLRRGGRLDPVLASALRSGLEGLGSEQVPEEVADVIDWLGATDSERGQALRDVLRLYDTIERSRSKPNGGEAQAPRYPRFEVRPGRRAS